MITKVLSRQIIFFLITIYTGNLYAEFKVLVEEFLGKSFEIEQLKLKTLESQYKFKMVEDFNSWSFNSNISNREANKDALFAFQAVETHTNSFSVGLDRSFDYGTHIGINHQRLQYDLSNWPSSTLAGLDDEQLYETVNTITVTQNLWKNFFGRSRRLDLSIGQSELDINRLNIRKERQNIIFNLYKGYIQSRQSLSLKDLNFDYLEIKKKRLRLISKKLKENTVEKIDYYRSQMNLSIASENLEKSKETLIESTMQLSTILNRQFNVSEIKSYDLKEVNFVDVVKQDITQNYDIQINQKQLSLLSKKRRKIDDDSAPNLNLKYSLIQNAIESTQDESIENAFPGRDNKEQIIMLEFSTPLGESTVDTEEKMNNVQIQQYTIKDIQLRRDIQNNAQVIFDRLKSTKEEIKFGQQRNKFANLVLAESKKEFNRGRIDLEQLIRAEEEVIEAKIGLIQRLARYDLLIGQYYFLTSKFNEKIASYKE